MKVAKEIKKEEAIKRMKTLGLFGPCIKAFENRNEIQLSEPTGGLYEFSGDEWLTNFVKEFEEEHIWWTCKNWLKQTIQNKCCPIGKTGRKRRLL